MAVARGLLKEEVVTVTNSVVKLNTLIVGAALHVAVNRLTVHNLDAAVNLEILQKTGSAPTSGTMDILTPDSAKTMPYEKRQLDDVYVYAAAPIKVCVIQEGP